MKVFFRVLRRCIPILLFGLFFPTNRACATAMDDFSFELPGGYLVLRANAEDIHIWKRIQGQSIDVITKVAGVGPVFEMAMDDRYIFLKNRGEQENRRNPPQKIFWTIIDYTEQTVYGPCAETEFQNRIAALGISHTIPWESLEKAFKRAVRDGRVNTKELDLQLLAQIMFAAIIWAVIYAPIITVIAVLVAALGKRIKGWTFMKAFRGIWLSLSAVTLIIIAAQLVIRWFCLRFL